MRKKTSHGCRLKVYNDILIFIFIWICLFSIVKGAVESPKIRVEKKKEKENKLIIMSLNTNWLFSQDPFQKKSWKSKIPFPWKNDEAIESHILAIVDLIIQNRPHIVHLCELESREMLQKVAKLIHGKDKELKYKTRLVFVGKVDSVGSQHFNGFLSRTPLVKSDKKKAIGPISRSMYYYGGSFQNSQYFKTHIIGVFELPNKRKLVLVGVHFSRKCSLRLLQWNLLKAFLRDLKKEHKPDYWVFIGDFNVVDYQGLLPPSLPLSFKKRQKIEQNKEYSILKDLKFRYSLVNANNYLDTKTVSLSLLARLIDLEEHAKIDFRVGPVDRQVSDHPPIFLSLTFNKKSFVPKSPTSPTSLMSPKSPKSMFGEEIEDALELGNFFAPLHQVGNGFGKVEDDFAEIHTENVENFSYRDIGDDESETEFASFRLKGGSMGYNDDNNNDYYEHGQMGEKYFLIVYLQWLVDRVESFIRFGRSVDSSIDSKVIDLINNLLFVTCRQ